MWFLPDFRQVYDPFKLNMDKNRERHFNCCGTPKVGFLYFPSFSEFFDSTLSKMRALPQFSCFCCFETTPFYCYRPQRRKAVSLFCAACPPAMKPKVTGRGAGRRRCAAAGSGGPPGRHAPAPRPSSGRAQGFRSRRRPGRPCSGPARGRSLR